MPRLNSKVLTEDKTNCRHNYTVIFSIQFTQLDTAVCSDQMHAVNVFFKL